MRFLFVCAEIMKKKKRCTDSICYLQPHFSTIAVAKHERKEKETGAKAKL